MASFKAEPGDTVLITKSSSIFVGKQFIVLLSNDRVVQCDVNRGIAPAWFFHNEYKIIVRSEQKITPSTETTNPICPECKGAGTVLLFNFSSPCKMCFLKK